MRAARAILTDHLKQECGSGAGSEACYEYMKDKVLPVLQRVAGAMVAQRPENPESFAAIWIAEQLGVPPRLVEELRSFVQGNLEEVDDTKSVMVRPPPGKPRGERPPSGGVSLARDPASPCKTNISEEAAAIGYAAAEAAVVAAGPPDTEPDAAPHNTGTTGTDGAPCEESMVDSNTSAVSRQSTQVGEKTPRTPKRSVKRGLTWDLKADVSNPDGTADKELQDGILKKLGNAEASDGEGQTLEESCLQCPCGNTLLVDSDFCRKCGTPREQGWLDRVAERHQKAEQERRDGLGEQRRNSDTGKRKRRGTVMASRGESFAFGLGDDFVPPSPPEVIEMLRKSSAMQACSAQDLARVADIASAKQFHPDQQIVGFGQACDTIHIIVKGTGRVSVPQFVGTIGQGDFIAEQGLTSKRATSANQVLAGTEGLLTLAIHRSEFEALKITQDDKSANKKKLVGRNKGAGVAVTEEEEDADGSGKVTTLKTLKIQCDKRKIAREIQDVEKELIVKSMQNNTTLSDVVQLSDDQCKEFANAAHCIEVPAGEDVFKVGDVGTAFFVVSTGLLEVYLPGGGVLPLRVGDSFGELALMYDEPRSATVTAKVPTQLWVLPRNVFKEMCRASAKQLTLDISNTLSTIPFLRERLAEHAFALAASLVDVISFAQSENICDKGEDEGSLFVIYEGECEYMGDGNAELEGKALKKGDFIGQTTMLKEAKAEETVFVRSDLAKVLVMSRESLDICIEASARGLNSESQWQTVTSESAKSKFRRGVRKVLTNIKLRNMFRRSNDMDITAGHDIQQCDVVGPLGEGSFGLVLLLRNKETKKEYAIKALSKQHLKDENQEDMVKHERNIMLVLNSHFIIRLYQAYEDSTFLFLMLEPAMGGELFDIYTEHNLWGKSESARFYIASIVLGLNYMHSKRVVWRDLKLENCLIDSVGNLKLTDMGIAKIVIGVTYTVVGTADYLAPEILRQLGHNRAADWWACGILLYIMMVGSSPFDAPQVSQIYRNIVKGFAKVTFPDDCPKSVESVIKALCKKKPEERITMQKGGISNLQAMSFFEKFSWDALESRSLTPPFVPGAPDYEKVRNKKLSRDVNISWDEVKEYDPGVSADVENLAS